MRTKTSIKEEILSLDKTLNDKFRFNELENSYLRLQKEHSDLKSRLVSLLLPEQVDAAKTCGVTPEMYALEWIDVHFRDARDKSSLMYKLAPSFADYVGSLRGLR
jgi:hypothetical protein